MRGWNWMILPTFCAGFVVCWKWPMINFWNLDYQVFASLVSCHKLTVSTFTCYMNSINFPGTISIHEGPWTCTASSGRKSPAWTIALWDVTGSMVVCTSPTGWMVVVTCRRGQLARLSELLDVWNPVWVKDFFIRFSERYVCCWHMFCFTILFKGIQLFEFNKKLLDWSNKTGRTMCAGRKSQQERHPAFGGIFTPLAFRLKNTQGIAKKR